MTDYNRGFRAGLEAAAKKCDGGHGYGCAIEIRALRPPEVEPDEPSRGTPFPPNFSYEMVTEIAEFGEFVPSAPLVPEGGCRRGLAPPSRCECDLRTS